jgi:hypothetical protein
MWRACPLQLFLQTRQNCQLRLQVPRLRERLAAGAAAGDMRSVLDNLNRAFNNDKLSKDSPLFHFIADLAKNLNANTSKGNRQAPACTHAAVTDFEVALRHRRQL